MSMQLPAYLRKTETASKFLSGLGGNQLPTINRRNNRFTLIDGAGNQKPVQTLFLDVIVIDGSEFVSKTYYEDDYDASNPAAPDCFSDNGTAASTQAAKPQNAAGGYLCATCPHNAWGSAISKMSGKQTKECQDSKKLACLVPLDGARIVYMLQVPPASFKNYRQWVASLAGNGVEPGHVVTRLEFDNQMQGVLTFKAMSFIDEPTSHQVEAALQKGGADSVVGRMDKPRQAALPTPERQTPMEVARQVEQQPLKEEPFFKQEPVAKQVEAQQAQLDDEMEQFRKWKASQEAAKPKTPGRGRPKKEEAAARNETVLGKGPVPEGMFPTEKSAQPAVQDQGMFVGQTNGSSHMTGASPSKSFGMEASPAAPDDAMSKMLDDVFALPT